MRFCILFWALLSLAVWAESLGDGFIESEPKQWIMLDNGLIYLWEDEWPPSRWDVLGGGK